jgi:hypothetical protein
MTTRMRVLGLVLGASALLATGCGKLTIESWVKVVQAQSTGSLQSDLLGTAPVPIVRLQGGFQGAIVLNTTTLPAPLDGTVAVNDVRIAGDTNSPQAFSIVGIVCVWGDPNAPSSGTIHLDILGSKGSTTLTLNLRATAAIVDLLGVPPVSLSQTATFPLNNIGLTQLLNASSTGSADGLFATSASFSGTTTLLDNPATFSLDLAVDNGSTPPLFDADILAECGPHFAEQGRDIFYGLNSKSSYLQGSPLDKTAAPLVIPLADIGAKPGDTLKIARVGTYDDISELRDGNQTAAGAVFSSSNTVNASSQHNRIPGAIAASGAPAFNTGFPSDIPQDFAIANSPTVTIPAGAAFLIIAPVPPSHVWNDNSGVGFGVSLTVNP